MRSLPIIIFLSVLIISCSGDQKQAGGSGPAPVAVDVLIAAETILSNELEGNGTVLSREMVELRPETSGRLVQLKLTDGAFVRKGTLLAKINDAELQAQLRQQTVQLDLARRNKGRYEELLTVNGVNQADYDAAVNEVAALEAAVDITRAQIEKTEVRAPFDGRLGLRMVSPGAYVTPQTLLGTLQESDQVKIDFTLPEQYGERIRTGMDVRVIGAGENEVFAVIQAIDPQVNTSTRNLRVRAGLKSGYLKPGSFVKVRVQDPVQGIVVPTEAIIPDAVSSKLILVRQGKGVFVNVKTGFRTPDFVHIAEGLTKGDSIVVTGVLFVRPNAPIKVRSVKPLVTSVQ